jgi:tRNA dimethylallyltransferase
LHSRTDLVSQNLPGHQNSPDHPDRPVHPGRTPLVIIAGPTATGKSAVLPSSWRCRLNGAVISADSMQVYRGMDIGYRQDHAGRKCGAFRHYLIDVADPKEEWNVVRFQEAAKKAVRKSGSRAEGRLPILCGGTGFYIQALL